MNLNRLNSHDRLWPGARHFQEVAMWPTESAPRDADILTPTANDQPADVLVRCGARDVVTVNNHVMSLSLTGRSFLAHGESLLAKHPLQEVRLMACAFLADELAVCLHWQRLSRVNLRGNQLGVARLRVLLKSGLLTHLEAIDLCDNGLSSPDIEELQRAFPLASATNSIRF
jgi:hypothetical protein